MIQDKVRRRADRVAELLNEIGDLFVANGIPKTMANKVVQWNVREGWELNHSLMFTLQSRERTMPADHAQ